MSYRNAMSMSRKGFREDRTVLLLAPGLLGRSGEDSLGASDDRFERELEFKAVDRVPLVLKFVQKRVISRHSGRTPTAGWALALVQMLDHRGAPAVCG